MPVPTLQRIRAKFGASKETKLAIPATEVTHKPQNVQPQGFYVYPKEYYPPHLYERQPPAAGFRQVDQSFVASPQNQDQPVSPIHPWSPQDFGSHQTFGDTRGGPAVELEDTRNHWPQPRVQRQPADEQHLRQHQMNPQRRALEEAKFKTKLISDRNAKAKAEEVALRRLQSASKESVRELRMLVRERYRLELSLLGEKGVLVADRGIVLKHCKQADELLQRIYSIVTNWDEDLFDSKEDWRVARKIKEGLIKTREDGLHNLWVQRPPWEIDSDPEQERTSDDEWDESDDE